MKASHVSSLLLIALLALLLASGCGDGRQQAGEERQDQAETGAPGETRSPSQAGEGTGYRVGQVAPDFMLTSLDGGTVSLSDYRGKVVVVDFWATWCPPCKKAMPHLQEIHETYAGRNVVVLGLSVDQTGEKVVRPFVTKYGYSFPMLMMAQSVAPRYGVQGIPATFILDPEGKVHKTFVGYQDKSAYTAAIDELLDASS